MPQRIQRKRAPGWKMPENTVYVGRPGPWGNPFSVKAAEEAGYRPASQMAVYAFRQWLRGDPDYHKDNLNERKRFILAEVGTLRGKNLACWCKEGEPCHADVLLELANP